MSFEVSPGILDTVGDEIIFLGGTTGMARLQADRIPDASGGQVFMHLQDMVVQSRAELVASYERGQHYPMYFARAGLALRACADDYRSVDHATRARLDALMTGAEPLPDNQQLHGDADDHGATTSLVYSAMDDDSSLADWSQWRTVREVLDHSTSLVAWLQTFGLYSSPLSGIVDSLDGDWEVLDETWSCFRRLRLYWEAVREEMAESVAYLDTGWSGMAASRVFDWFDQFDAVLRDHELALMERADRVVMVHDGLQLAIEGIRPYLDLISQIIGEYAADLITFGDAVTRLTNAFGLALLVVDALVLTVGITNLGFSLLPVRDLAVPDDSLGVLAAPEVAGP